MTRAKGRARHGFTTMGTRSPALWELRAAFFDERQSVQHDFGPIRRPALDLNRRSDPWAMIVETPVHHPAPVGNVTAIVQRHRAASSRSAAGAFAGQMHLPSESRQNRERPPSGGRNVGRPASTSTCHVGMFQGGLQSRGAAVAALEQHGPRHGPVGCGSAHSGVPGHRDVRNDYIPHHAPSLLPADGRSATRGRSSSVGNDLAAPTAQPSVRLRTSGRASRRPSTPFSFSKPRLSGLCGGGGVVVGGEVGGTRPAYSSPLAHRRSREHDQYPDGVARVGSQWRSSSFTTFGRLVRPPYGTDRAPIQREESGLRSPDDVCLERAAAIVNASPDIQRRCGFGPRQPFLVICAGGAPELRRFAR